MAKPEPNQRDRAECRNPYPFTVCVGGSVCNIIRVASGRRAGRSIPIAAPPLAHLSPHPSLCPCGDDWPCRQFSNSWRAEFSARRYWAMSIGLPRCSPPYIRRIIRVGEVRCPSVAFAGLSPIDRRSMTPTKQHGGASLSTMSSEPNAATAAIGDPVDDWRRVPLDGRYHCAACLALRQAGRCGSI